ncbi:MarR family winged helix-turn-helix transcriptional regulator [Dyadobacter sp. CY356]|uniref:MarR family winged helix-turn-helix transcriptional regulator n=1 Tax=Dyadobacter sp. CY356 TaxID=2906442 RepID=UPI001F18E18E|nr:MarR family transcriptional regulator [Dyadobacter sp. CY356]MCF0054406.1 MarR family transcriptional regulator [Dyadobacter sp. CY356]
MSIETDIKQKKFRSPYQRMGLNLVYTSNWIQYQQMEIFREFDITSQQFNVLRILRGQHPNPIKVSDIADRMLDKNSNTSRLIDKLLVKKLVDRKSCPNDRRAVDVIITEEGLELLKKLDPEVEKWEANMTGITPDEADLISTLLDKLRNSKNNN